MSHHIFKQEAIVPSTFKIDVRNVLDAGGPHLMSFGCRCVQADPSSGATVTMGVRYENPNGEIQSLFLPAAILLSDTSQAGGGIWYHDVFQTIDKYWPLANGPYSENPLGVFSIDFTLSAPPLTSLFTYEAIVETFDGSPAVIFHP